MIYSHHGYKCVKANSGKVALTYFEKEEINLVVLDIMMPEMDGWTSCKKIRQLSDVPYNYVDS
ncbi:response regulator [Neobacillus drentensis]|uniref:response regulator n=1 Tax=Neobacillus drentensis TaxID=220684 RepID=UPI003D2F56AB